MFYIIFSALQSSVQLNYNHANRAIAIIIVISKSISQQKL